MSYFTPGDVVFVMHHDNKLSRLIGWFMKSQWSHSALVIGSDRNRTYLCETSDFEVTLGQLDTYLLDPNCSVEVWSPVDLDSKTKLRICRRTIQNIGSIYPWFQLLSFALRNSLRRVGIKIKNLITYNYTCNQNWVSAYVLESSTPFYGLDPKQQDTEESYEIVVSSGRFQKIYERRFKP